MASVNRDPTRKRTPWVVRWRDEAGTLRKKGFGRKIDADRFRAEVEHSLNVGSYIDPKGGKRTFRDCAEEVRKSLPHRPNTASRWESSLRLHVYPAFGEKPIGSLRPTRMQGFATDLSTRLKPGSVAQVMAVVGAVFNSMVKDRVIGSNPCKGITLPEIEDEEIIPLTVEMVEALADAIDPRYRGLVAVGAGLGVRQGEGLGLETHRVDFLKKRRVRIEQQVQPLTKATVAVVPPKVKAATRWVPAADAILMELSAHLAAYPPVEVEVEDHTGPKPKTRKAKFVFSTPDGMPLVRWWFNDHVWLPARAAAAAAFRKRAAEERDPDRRAELERQAEQLATCGYHDLRHFYASLLIRKGLNVKVVAARLGHANPTETLRTYTHLWPDDEDRSREAIQDVFGHDQMADVPSMRPSVGA
ncbi:tyrosine-type recombinase/integrase [Phytohabitans sp. ZYX-F-186]|uniref:Tyrosine-type recombinase/integrase n=1 Tax=Phytohabitans maris TaxID=3071409 RepID=A0ABU0ZTW1_9ACTN|nr:tyrosine-type recombinase/integrase [Phytohabitans sp. ZYX-F-186]MDQ7910236.1 tyrosine-type recombinase/integrase [Phytohabitans sp. ZYX-F-186]